MLNWLAPALGAVGKVADWFTGRDNAKAQMAAQREFAQKGIQWKVADARAAGIHPIYALGASTHQYAPVSVGGGLGDIGQDIGRAISATSSQSGKASTIAQSLALENQSLQNEMLKSQIARLRSQPTPPLPTPETNYSVPGQAESGELPAVKEKMERKNWNPNNPSGEAMAIPEVGYSRTPMGGYYPVPSDEVKQRIEDNELQEFMHGMRNMVEPAMKPRSMNPPYPAPEGTAWVYDIWRGYHLYDYVNKKYLHKDY